VRWLPLLALTTWPSLSFAAPVVLDGDLNGDGVPEKVTINSQSEPKASCTVAVGKISYSTEDRWGDGCTGEIIDIDSGDPKKELVLIFSSGTDFATELYLRFDGKTWRVLGEYSGTFSGTREVPGAGFVLHNSWAGFFAKKVKLVLAKEQLKELVPELYAVDVTAKVKSSFPIQVGRSQQEPLAKLKVGSEIRVLAYDPSPKCKASDDHPFEPCDLFLVRSASGLLGWARFDQLQSGADLPWAG
jgi:hypothetical protein